MNIRLLAATLIAGCVTSGCGTSGGTTAPDPVEIPADEHPAVTEARLSLPRFAEIQNKVFSKTCSPNPGVCHNSNNYPSLETAGNSLAWIGADCNLELPNPLDGWDACEREAGVLSAGSFASRIAWFERESPGSWRVRLVDAAPVSGELEVTFANADGTSFYDPPLVESDDLELAFSVTVALVAGSRDARVRVNTANAALRASADSILATVRGGDPNHNGVFGAESLPSGAVIHPGDLSRSYLWGRITGTVPGSRMPLANAPLTLPAYIAIACWIEGLDGAATDAADPIDYDACAFADAPVDYTVQ